MAATVLVTGAAGFVGSTLVDRLLAEGRRVVGIDDLSGGDLATLARARSEHPGAFEFHRMDVGSDALDAIVQRHRPQVVLHLAAHTDHAHAWSDPLLAARVNVLGTLRLLEAARRGEVEKVVLASDRLLEDAPPTPRAVAARACEAYVRAWGEQCGLRWTVVGLANVYGPRGGFATSPGVVACFLDRQATREPCMVHGDGQQTRDLLHVDDAVDALARAIGRGDGRRVDVGSGVATSVARLHDALRLATGSPHAALHGPERPHDVSHGPVDVAPAHDALGWRPFTPLDQGLAATVRERVAR